MTKEAQIKEKAMPTYHKFILVVMMTLTAFLSVVPLAMAQEAAASEVAVNDGTGTGAPMTGEGAAATGEVTTGEVGADGSAAAPLPELPPPLIDEQAEMPFANSLFLTAEEIANIKQALVGLDAGAAQNAMVPARRLIKLSGIVYNGENDWVVWLNGKRLTPRFLLPEILEMQVTRQYVDLKWFDIGLNKVIKIKLAPHQVYDVATGILLTGGGINDGF